MSSADEQFAWTFPLYVLGANHVVGPNGEIIFNKDTLIITASDGRLLPVFTDDDLAVEFRQICDPAIEILRFPLDPEHAIRLLTTGSPPEIEGVVIDPNPKTGIGLKMEKSETVQEWARYLEQK